jgi:tRNA(adenine34) deaminase
MTDHDYMQQALALAQTAAKNNEVPVGAVIVLQDTVIATAFNQPISLNDPCAHAEILALRSAANSLGNYRLLDTTLYVTLEPCAMCAAAMVHARIKRLVYATDDPKTGVVQSHLQLLNNPIMNHQVEVTSGILAEPAKKMLQAFFKERRKK